MTIIDNITKAQDLLEIWRDLKERRNNDHEVQMLEEQLRRLNERVDETRRELIALDRDRFDPAIAEAEEKLSEAIFKLESSIHIDRAKASYTSGYVRVTYDAKDIDRVLAKNPAIAEIINPYRKEKAVEPRVKLELFDE